MTKFLSIFSLSFLFISNIFGQAAVDIPLLITDGSSTIPLAVGLDITATNCIDPQLGEYDVPSVPPGIFESKFELNPYGCPNMSSYKDYRPPGDPPVFPFTGMIEHTLWWITSSFALPIDITYEIPPIAEMYLTDQIGGSVLNLGPFTGQGLVTIPSSYTSIFNRALLIMEYNGITPAELTSFTASALQNEKAIQLNWSTATETNNYGFEILRFAQNDNQWEKIGFVPGFGTTTEPKYYTFIDEDIKTGTYKYRLKQIDFDGSFEYSNEIEVEVDFSPKEFVLYQNYPNPFNPKTVISYQLPVTSNVNLKVYDVLGNEVATLVNEEKQPGVYEVEFHSERLSSGIYFYQLKTGSFSSIKKMVLLK